MAASGSAGINDGKIRMRKGMVSGIKGVLMGMLFGLFLAGILIELFLVLPVVRIMEGIYGSNPDRMQGVQRRLMGAWIVLLRVTGMLKASAPRGEPFDGPCVVVSNHPGLFDVLFLIRDIPRMSVLVKPSLARKLPLGPIFRSAGYVLAPDGRNVSPLASLQAAVERIRSGQKFLLFPEGTRSPKGGLLPFKTGAFRIAGMAGVPIQPVLIRNMPPFLPKEDKWYFPPSPISLLEMEFWEPVGPPEMGEEEAFAQELEHRYRRALGVNRDAVEQSTRGG